MRQSPTLQVYSTYVCCILILIYGSSGIQTRCKLIALVHLWSQSKDEFSCSTLLHRTVTFRALVLGWLPWLYEENLALWNRPLLGSQCTHSGLKHLHGPALSTQYILMSRRIQHPTVRSGIRLYSCYKPYGSLLKKTCSYSRQAFWVAHAPTSWRQDASKR